MILQKLAILLALGLQCSNGHTFSYNVELNQTIIVSCPHFDKDSSILQFWEVPGSQILVPEGIYDAYKFHVSPIDGSLTIRNVEDEDIGYYHCNKTVNGESHRENVILRLKVVKAEFDAEYWENQLEGNLIRGGIAAGITAFVLVFACFIYKMRWKNKETGDSIIVGKPQTVASVEKSSYLNHAVEKDDYGQINSHL